MNKENEYNSSPLRVKTHVGCDRIRVSAHSAFQAEIDSERCGLLKRELSAGDWEIWEEYNEQKKKAVVIVQRNR